MLYVNSNVGEAQNFLKIKHTEYASPPMFALKKAVVSTQCPRTDLNKRFLPRPKTTTA